MTKQYFNAQKISVILLVAVLAQGCVSVKLHPVLPTARDIEPIATEAAMVTPTVIVENTATATPTEIVPTETSVPKATLTAIKGNIFIRRGPGMAYNPIGVLYKNTSTEVIARDVLSKWVQVLVPESDATGWVSIQTEYSQLNGEFDSLPDFTYTDWPVPAYLENCTEHDMYIMPGNITVTSVFTHPENEVWLYPGHYTAQDLFVPGKPEVMDFDIREGEVVNITINGLGENHKCP